MKKYLVVGGFFLLVLFLVACSGEEATAVPDSPTEPPPTETSPPPTTTSLPPTATTEPEPTNTAVPVLAPTETAVPEPTAEAETEGDAALGSRQSACDNPWLPIREGATWTYEGSESGLVWTVTDVEGDLENATGQMQVDVADVVLNYMWECTPEGMASFDFATLAIPVAGFDLTLEAESMSGQFLLPAEQMTVGTTWEFVVTMNITGALSDGTAISGSMVHTQAVQVVNADAVTIDGRTVDGLQIQRDSTIEMNVSAAGVSLPMPPMSMSQTHTMAYGIGITEMVTMTSFGGSADILTLASWSVP
jgi:hypothetical protein